MIRLRLLTPQETEPGKDNDITAMLSVNYLGDTYWAVLEQLVTAQVAIPNQGYIDKETWQLVEVCLP